MCFPFCVPLEGLPYPPFFLPGALVIEKVEEQLTGSQAPLGNGTGPD